MESRVLIADDSLSVRKIVREYLNRRGIAVCGEAEDGQEAIEKAITHKPDLVVLDLAIPRANGCLPASALKDMLPDVPIILFTMYSDAIAKTLGKRKLRVDAIVPKSDGITKLADCVQGLLGTGKNPVRSEL